MHDGEGVHDGEMCLPDSSSGNEASDECEAEAAGGCEEPAVDSHGQQTKNGELLCSELDPWRPLIAEASEIGSSSNLVDSKGRKADRVEKRNKQKARGGRKKKQPTDDEKEKGNSNRPPKSKKEEATKKEEEKEERNNTRPPASLQRKRLTGKQAVHQLCKI